MISVERLRQVLSYDPHTGIFTWIAAVGRGRPAHERIGKGAGWIDMGRHRISIDGGKYLASVLAWAWMTGRWPENDIDHKDTNCLNDKWDNLRPATRTQNNANQRRRSDNTSGQKGVSWSKACGKWYAKITVNKQQIPLGIYDCRAAAAFAYMIAADVHFKQYARPL